MNDDTINQDEAGHAAKPSVEQQDMEMTSTSNAPQTAEQRTAEKRERHARNKAEYELEQPIIGTGNRTSLQAMMRGANEAFTKTPVQRLGDADRQTDPSGTVDNRPKTPTKDLDAPQTAEQQAIAARRARRKEALSIDPPILDAGNKISLRVMRGGANQAFTSLRAVNHTGNRQTDLRGTISNRPEIPSKDAAQTFFEEQQRNVKAGDTVRITYTISNEDGVMKSHSVYNSAEVQQNKREQHLMGHRRPEKDDSPTISERDDDAMDMDADRRRKRPRGDGFQAAAPSQGSFQAAAPSQGGFQAESPSQGGFQADSPNQGGFQAAAPRQGGFQADSPNQGGFHHKHRRGRRGQRSSKKTQAQAPVFQQQGNQNSSWANPKPSNPRLAAFTAPNSDITKTSSSSSAYGQPVMSQASQSQPAFQSKPFSATTNTNDQKRLFLGQPKPTPTTAANADLDASPVKAEKEEDEYYTSSLHGYTRPFSDFQ